MGVLDAIGRSLDEGFFMFWATLWALVLGFGLSGAVQAFVSRTQMQHALGDHRPRTLAKSSFFGVVSSSCSYAASALAKSLFARGADFTASMVFMVASTNLVVELGIVLWLLIGWQFALAEFVGGAIMIVLLGLLLPRVIPEAWIAEARARLNDDGVSDTVAAETASGHLGHTDHAGGGHEHHGEPADTRLTSLPWGRRLRSKAGWADSAGYTISDLTMIRRELLVGFVVAGALAVEIPTAWWQSMFWTGHGFASSVENVLLGPFLAIISFVCSVGNVPLAAALWKGGISFGGVISFVFADLITLPLLSIYRRYFGTRLTLRLLGAFWTVMSAGGLATEYLFRAFDLRPPRRPSRDRHDRFPLELHERPGHRRARGVRRYLLAPPTQGPFRRRPGIRQRPRVRHAGRDRARARHRRSRRCDLPVLLRPLPAALHRRSGAVRSPTRHPRHRSRTREEPRMTELTVPPHAHPIDADRVSHARARLPTADDAARLTSLLSLMADPVRIRILYALDLVEELCVGDLALALDVNEDQTGYALKLLRSSGLVKARKEGRVVFNRLAPDFPEPLRQHCLGQLVAISHAQDDES